MAEAVDAIVRFQEASAALDDAACRYLGLARSELLCLAAIERGPLTASTLAQRLNLSRGAITALVDRLEARSFVTREPVATDRRRVRIALTLAARDELTRIYGPIVADGRLRVRELSDAELATIVEFLQAGRELQARHASRVRAMPPRSGLGRRG
jgi:DNA-binding MarR family transcriptional regulator